MSEGSKASGTDEQADRSPIEAENGLVQTVRDRVSNQMFGEWYKEQQVKENILQGQAYFNGPSPPKDPEQHTPSKLLQCHRKAMYDRQNAPSEGTSPEGLFWIGSEFEEQVIVPFLQDEVTTEETYVQNSIWTDAEITTNGTSVRVRGSTDPVIVTPDGDPLFVTEIKTTKSLDHLSSPKPHHKAQLHAYLYALNQEYDHTIADGMVVYGSRTTFDIEAFYVEFDSVFWDHVKRWLVLQTEYAQDKALPPADPERDWECSYCSYRHRCGKADTPYSDIGIDGLLPLFEGYDKQLLVEYLEAHSDADAKLTPTLAHEFPDLVKKHDVYDWECPSCAETYVWDDINWEGATADPPICPNCLESGDLVTVSGPEPSEQLFE